MNIILTTSLQTKDLFLNFFLYYLTHNGWVEQIENLTFDSLSTYPVLAGMQPSATGSTVIAFKIDLFPSTPPTANQMYVV